MRAEVVESWNRCKKRGLSHNFQHDQLETLSREELAQLQEQHAPLIEVASPIIRDLHKLVYGSGFLTLLTTDDGVVLEVLPDPATSLFTTEVQLVPGAVWREEMIGTSAIGLAIREKKPQQVVGKEHYWSKLHDMTCSAAPIFDPQKRVIGVVNVSGPVHSVHTHTLGMVVASARAIERQLQLRQTTEALQQTNQTLNVLLDVVDHGVVLIDESLTIRQANSIACSILKTDKNRLLYQNITQFFPNLRLHESVRAHTPLQDELTQVPSLGVTCLLQVTPVFTRREGVAAVVTFREVQKIRRQARKINGNQAYITLDELKGSSQWVKQLKEQIKLAAKSDATVLLQGETGCGKEIVAQSIHNVSERRNGPFIVVNCAAIPRTLLESELFGYEAGTFTGGDKRGRPGKFELADEGTIFLDEIGEMTLDMQVLLLRVLQERRVTRLGGNRMKPIDIRILAATNKDLPTEIRAGRFRADLYYRLNIINIHIAPLRSRLDDIPQLVEWFVAKHTPAGEKKKRFDRETLSVMQQYHWPGNVRELENVVQRCLIMTPGDVIKPNHLPIEIRNNHGTNPSHFRNSSPLHLPHLQQESFFKALETTGGNVTKAAKILGISRATAYRWVRKYSSE